jgi:EAL domain-containing protein (putative c-di-GMP-specific phosphodiesterase class I)
MSAVCQPCAAAQKDDKQDTSLGATRQGHDSTTVLSSASLPARCAWRSPNASWLVDIENTQRTLASLKEVGVQIAIDDVGTGYAALSHLKSLPVDTLKIDAGFVRDLDTSAGDQAIVRAIIGLAEAFDLQLVADGVETTAVAPTLMRHGCYRAQGYLPSRPVAADTMASLLSTRRLPMAFFDHDKAFDAARDLARQR